MAEKQKSRSELYCACAPADKGLCSLLNSVLIYVMIMKIKHTTLCKHHKVSNLVLEYSPKEQPLLQALLRWDVKITNSVRKLSSIFFYCGETKRAINEADYGEP